MIIAIWNSEFGIWNSDCAFQIPNSKFLLPVVPLRRKRLVDRRAIEAQLLEVPSGVELLPEVERDARLRRSRTPEDDVDQAEQRSGEVFRAQPVDGRQLTFHDLVLDVPARDDRVHP